MNAPRDRRPDPDQLLKHVQAEEASAGRGRLKLFFGASPGVGKTYAMLEAARQRRREGWEVVAGLVETHGRVDTEALAEGLEMLPRKEILYKGVVLREFDLDAALKRRPRLILVDELAHTNAEGLRHAKRWQDVEELLDAGIDVYTTLNVQHWESLNDVVAQITGVSIRETVPDNFLDRADEIELVDLAPEDLLKRLREGKVYRGEVAGRAAENFFRPGNLIALRELALRHAAERVDAQMRAFKERHAIGDAWAVGERLLVGVTGSPGSARLVRAAGRLAARLRTPWIAAHVETRDVLAGAAADREAAVENLRLAQGLGAETLVLTGEDVTEELLALARKRHVTRIVLGQPARPRWREWLFGSVVNNAARRCGDIDLHIVSGMGPDARPRRRPPAERGRGAAGFLWGTAVAGLASLVCWPLAGGLDRVNLIMVYLVGIVVAAYRFGRRASAWASILSVLCFDFFFVPPTFTFAIADTQYVLTFAAMLGVGLLISTIMGRLRLQTLSLRRRQERLRALYKLSRDLSETPDTASMLKSAAAQLREFYGRPVLLLTVGADGQLEAAAGDPAEFEWNENERSVARWVFDKSQLAGAGSDTLSGAKGLYLPLTGRRSTVGVLGLRAEAGGDGASPDALELLETFASEIGGALESTRLSEAIGRAEVRAEGQAIERAAAAGTRLVDALPPERLVFLSDGLTNEQIIRTLLARMDLPNPTRAFHAVMERERAAPTVLGPGIRAPHARIAGLDKIRAAMGVSQSAGDIWLVFLGPEDRPRDHLGFLSLVASFFQEPGRKEAVVASESLEILHRRLSGGGAAPGGPSI